MTEGKIETRFQHETHLVDRVKDAFDLLNSLIKTGELQPEDLDVLFLSLTHTFVSQGTLTREKARKLTDVFLYHGSES